MSGEWPDEVRQMVDALAHGGACPSVYGCGDGGHRIHTGRAWADYDVDGDWLFQGACVSGAVVLAELLQRSDTTAPAQTRDPRHALQERILAAVPGALVATTTDGIEVTVGSKSVRWKREKRGWSLGDDLFTSDERVIERAKGMAADAAPKPAAPSLLERLRTAIPSLTWRQEGDECLGRDENGSECVSVVHQIDLGSNQAYIATTAGETKDTATLLQRFDAVVQHIGRYLHGDGEAAPAAPQPSPRAQALLDALRAQGYEPTYKRVGDGEHVVCESERAARGVDDHAWTYLGGQAGTEYVAEQMHLRIARKRERASDTATQATASKRSPREQAAHELVALFRREFPGATVGFKGDGSCVWVERYSERVEWVQTTTGRWERPEEIAFGAEGTVPLTRHLLDEAAKRRGCSTVTVNGNILDTDALTRAIEEQSRREKAHAAKGPTMTTQDPEQRRRDEGVVMAELCRDVLRKHPNAVASACVVESERDWYYTLVLSEHFDDVEVQYENGRFYLYQRNATTAPSLTLEQARAVLLTSSTALIPMDDENTRTRARRIPSKRAVIHDIERIAPYSQWIAERTKRNEGATTMTTQTKTEALAQTIKLDASEAAWRTAGSQFVKLAREPLVGLLTRHLAPNDDVFRARLAAFLETELGTALLASMLSATLSALPQTTGEVPQKLARELRVKAMATAGDEITSVLSGPLLQVMRLYLQDPAGAPAAAPALDEPQHAPASMDWSKAREVLK